MKFLNYLFTVSLLLFGLSVVAAEHQQEHPEVRFWLQGCLTCASSGYANASNAHNESHIRIRYLEVHRDKMQHIWIDSRAATDLLDQILATYGNQNNSIDLIF